MSDQPPKEPTAEPPATIDHYSPELPAPLDESRPYSVDYAHLGREDIQYRFAHCYLYGPFALSQAKTYAFLYPNASPNTAHVGASQLMRQPKTQEHIRSLCARNTLSADFVKHEIAREAMRLTKKKRKQIMHNDEVVTLESEEDNDRSAALALAADVLGLRKNQETAGVTVNVQLGTGLDLSERPPIDVTPSSDDE
jgi:hypothetical protein